MNETIEEKMDGIHEDIQKFFVYVNTKLDQIEEEFEDVDVYQMDTLEMEMDEDGY